MENFIETYRQRSKNFKKTTSSKIKHRIYKQVAKNKETKEGVNGYFLHSILKMTPNFLGIFAQDHLQTLKLTEFPVTLVINLDFSNKEGSHWIALKVTRVTIEIYDSLGFHRSKHLFKPVILLKFLEKYQTNRTIYFTPTLQPDYSNMCGLYCIYFIFFRNYLSFKKCLSIFSSKLTDNDKTMFHSLSYI